MRILALAAASLAAAALAACSPAASSSSPAPAAPAAAQAPAATLPPLTPGTFPATADGTLARHICEDWQGLRSQYAASLDSMTPVQLGQWLSGPDWSAATADAAELGNDPEFSHLEAAFGTAASPATASLASARALDEACARAD